jgi:hypothetical protein
MMNGVEGGRRAFYKQQELEIVKWANKYSLKRRVNVDEESQKRVGNTGVGNGPLFDW